MDFLSDFDLRKIKQVIDDKLDFVGHFVRFFLRYSTVRFHNRPQQQSIPLEDSQVDFFSDFRKKRWLSRYSTFCPKPGFSPSLGQKISRGGSRIT